MGWLQELQRQVTGSALGTHVVHADLHHPLELPLDGLLRQWDGLRGVAAQLRESGYGPLLDEWQSGGIEGAASVEFEPRDMIRAFGRPRMAALSRETGVPLAQVTALLSRALPIVMDHFSPDGRLPINEPSIEAIVRLATEIVPTPHG